LLITTPDCEVKFANPQARRWLKEFFGRPERAGKLPRKVCRWVKGRATTPAATRSLVAKRDSVNLFVRRHQPHPADSIPLHIEVVKERSSGGVRPHGALTKREAEVLFWVENAKSNSQIAQILGIAEATVGKHLERVFEKLGVENRVAAANTTRIGPES
jgi:DNA-binding CsgD family transcriptional regulator